MPLFDNSFPSNYEEIRTYYPVWYYDVLDMDAVWRATGNQLDGVQSGIESLIDNNFVATADESTLSALERFLYIPTNVGRPVAERRQLIASFFASNSHIGAPELIDMVGTFVSGEVTVQLTGGLICITVRQDTDDIFSVNSCLFYLMTRIPAHLALTFDVDAPVESGQIYVASAVGEFCEEVIC